MNQKSSLRKIYLFVSQALTANRQFRNKNLMSLDEVKREAEKESDPLFKGRRRRLHSQLVAKNAIEQSPRATVLSYG